MKKGLSIAREGWSGKGLFVFKQIPSDIAADIIPKMQSVPDSVKKLLIGRMVKGEPGLHYTNQMAIVHTDGRVDSWVPSASDVFAEDYFIVE